MNYRLPRILIMTLLTLAWLSAAAGELTPIQLPEPRTDRGKPLMQALRLRQSRRRFGPDSLPSQVLSDLLWAAFGVNREDSGKRTAPSALNWQEIDIYVARADGLYLFDAHAHILNPVHAQDIRALAGRQELTQDAPVNLIYVADYSRMQAADDIKRFYSAANTGFISQNVYLFCASEGLATVVLGLINRPDLSYAMHLRATQQITLTQPVGYPR